MAGKQQQGECIFCGGGNLTKQHVIPNWMSRLFTADKVRQTISNHLLILDPLKKTTFIKMPVPLFKEHNGVFGQIKIRKVCKDCNNRWISSAEQSVIPFVEPMITGEDVVLSKKDIRAIALSFAIIAIMSEFTDPDPNQRSIPQHHLRYINKTKRLPHGWHVGVGLMEEGAALGTRVHHAKSLDKYRGDPAFHISTTVIGRMIFQVVVCSNFLYPVQFSSKQFLQLWPISEVDINWKEKLSVIPGEEFDIVADALHNVMRASFLNCL